MVRIMIVLMLLSFDVAGQREQYIRPGLITTGGTITPTFMLNRNESNYYVSGFLQGRLSDHVSLRGETHYFVDGNLEVPYLNFGSRTYFGFQYGLNKGNLDTYIGFMPGISVLRMNEDFNVQGDNPYHVTPSFSANIGVTYYIWKFFNFFANVTYVNSTSRGLRAISGRSDELMISAGLGLNINTIKAK